VLRVRPALGCRTDHGRIRSPDLRALRAARRRQYGHDLLLSGAREGIQQLSDLHAAQPSVFPGLQFPLRPRGPDAFLVDIPLHGGGDAAGLKHIQQDQGYLGLPGRGRQPGVFRFPLQRHRQAGPGGAGGQPVHGWPGRQPDAELLRHDRRGGDLRRHHEQRVLPERRLYPAYDRAQRGRQRVAAPAGQRKGI